MILMGSPVNRLFVSSPRDYGASNLSELVPLWGALPLLIYVEGAGYMTSPSRISINQLQGVLVLLPL